MGSWCACVVCGARYECMWLNECQKCFRYACNCCFIEKTEMCDNCDSNTKNSASSESESESLES